MSESFLCDERLTSYIHANWLREHPVLTALRAETAPLEDASKQIAPDQGQFMAFLVRLLGAKKCLEIGVYTGYSSTVVAQALPVDGVLVACDIDPEITAMARKAWQAAGVADKIQFHLGPATETLNKLVQDGHAGTFDFAFIDADKPSYPAYYELALQLVKTGGLIAIDNVLWHGRVADETDNEANTPILRELNARLHADERIDLCLVPIGDGVTLARKI